MWLSVALSDGKRLVRCASNEHEDGLGPHTLLSVSACVRRMTAPSKRWFAQRVLGGHGGEVMGEAAHRGNSPSSRVSEWDTRRLYHLLLACRGEAAQRRTLVRSFGREKPEKIAVPDLDWSC